MGVFIGAIVNVLLIALLNGVYNKVAKWLTKFENHETKVGMSVTIAIVVPKQNKKLHYVHHASRVLE